MFKTLALALITMTALASQAHAGQIFACLDNEGGTYTVRTGEGTVVCENNYCATPRLQSTRQLSAVRDSQVNKFVRDQMFDTLRMVLSGTMSDAKPNATTQFYVAGDTTVLCSLPISSAGYEEERIQEKLQSFLLN